MKGLSWFLRIGIAGVLGSTHYLIKSPPLLWCLITAFAWGYFWGSLTGGPVFAKIFHLGDLKKIGSGNIGTTNVLRTGHKTAAFLTLLFDAIKVWAAVKTVGWVSPSLEGVSLYAKGAALGALVGHLFPLFSGFSGGKGIATLAGISFTFSWILGVILVSIWALTAWLTGYSSLAGMVALLGAIPLSYVLGYPDLMYLFMIVTPLVLYRHKDNIHRLIEGRETKIGRSMDSSSRQDPTS
jgi:glycerol-3-phosphate acyltransferase PlsY